MTPDRLTPPRSQARRAAARARTKQMRRRRGVALAGVGAVLVLAVVGFTHLRGSGDSGLAEEQPSQLPGGGRSILPERRVVAIYGSPGAPELGTLGDGSPAAAAARLERLGADYQSGQSRKVLSAFELISTLVLSQAGDDGLYRSRLATSQIQRYLDAARRAHAILLLDIQPGRSDFLSEVKVLEPFLRQPDVGVALDPEWRMGPSEIPGEVVGHVEADEVNAVSDYLSQIVTAGNLPDKLLVIHQFTPDMIRDKGTLEPRAGLDIVPSADGVGDEPIKRAKFRELAPPTGGPFYRGFKLFLQEDTGLISPQRVLSLTPGPVDFVVYE